MEFIKDNLMTLLIRGDLEDVSTVTNIPKDVLLEYADTCATGGLDKMTLETASKLNEYYIENIDAVLSEKIKYDEGLDFLNKALEEMDERIKKKVKKWHKRNF